jgi:hypothetical protein
VNLHYRYFDLFVSFVFAVFAASLASGQDCLCNAPRGSFDSEVYDRAQPDLVPSGPYADELENGIGNNVAACAGPFCGYGCRSEGIFFSTETVFVDVWQPENDGIASELLDLNTPAAPDIENLDPDLDAAARFAFGYQTCDGLGIQARYWEFDNAAAVVVDQADPADPNLALHAWDVTVFDVEVVKNSMINQLWDKSLSGGYRFARYEEAASVRLDATELASVRTRYIGNGLTGAIGLRHQLAPRFSVMVNGRTSLLFGSQRISASMVTLPPHLLNSSFDTRYTTESQLGASYEYPICGGGYWFVRGGYEVQYWNDFVVPFGKQTEPSSTVLHGFFAAIGLQR